MELSNNITAAYESELNIIGLLVCHPDLYENKTPCLRAEYFADECNQSIFKIIQDYYNTNKRIDPAVIISNCSDVDIKKRMLEAAEFAIIKSTFDEHLSLIKTAYKNRQLKRLLEKLLFEDNLSYINSIAKLQEFIDNSNQDNSEETERYLEKYDTFLDELYKKHPVIKTGISRVDYLTGGLRKGTITILGARPSTGKTALALNIAEYALKNRKKVVIFSLEMTTNMILERIACTLCHIQYSKFANKTLSPDEAFNVENEITKLKTDKNLYVIDDIYTIEQITEKIAQIKPDFAVVDFIQIVNTLSHKESERIKINYISVELKRIAKRTNTCIMVLSQLKRNDKNDMPTMADLKESGGLEQDGDYIFLLFRPYVSAVNKINENPNETVLRLDKNKFGQIGDTELSFSGEYQRFTQIRKDIG